MKHKQPKTLIVDIETSYMTAVVWRLGEGYTDKKQILKDWSILAWTAKWRGSKKIIYRDTSKQKDPRNDGPILEELWNLMDEAEIVVGQNSKRFDIPKIFARFMQNNIKDRKPPSDFRQHDTQRMGKKYGFSSHSLEYMGKALKIKNQKLVKREFEGLELWTECIEHRNPKAWAEMRKYNPQDVLATEEIYEIFLPWDNSINVNTYHKMHDNVCSCGSTDFQKNGWRNSNAGRYQRYTCAHCGKHHKSAYNELSQKKRDKMLR